MNTYAARGLALAVAKEDRRVLVVTRGSEVREALREMAALLHPFASVRFANGRERITYPGGGRVDFVRREGRGYRGVSVDTVYLDTGLDDPETVADLLPCIQASPRGELVRA